MKRPLCVLLLILTLCLSGCSGLFAQTPEPTPSENPTSQNSGQTIDAKTYDFKTDGWVTTEYQVCGHGHPDYTDEYQERIVDCTCGEDANGTDIEYRIGCNYSGEVNFISSTHNNEEP